MKIKGSQLLAAFCILGILFLFNWKSLPSSSIQIPVDFSFSFLRPLTEIEIENKKYSLLLDSASTSNEFKLERDLLEKIKQKSQEEEDLYRVPQLKIGNALVFNSQIMASESAFNEKNKSNKKETKVIKEKIGLPFFKNYNCLFDFPKSEVILQKRNKKIENLCSNNDFVCIPFSLEPCGIVINVQTDSEVKRLALDTGAPYSGMNFFMTEENKKEKKGASYSTNELILGGCNYGEWDFSLVKLKNKNNIDGFLGVDFFLEHTIGIDFHHHHVYIKKPDKYTLPTQGKRFKTRTKRLVKMARW